MVSGKEVIIDMVPVALVLQWGGYFLNEICQYDQVVSLYALH